MLPLVELAVYPVPVRLTGVLEVRAGSGHDHLQEDVEDCVEGLSVPVSVGNTTHFQYSYEARRFIIA